MSRCTSTRLTLLSIALSGLIACGTETPAGSTLESTPDSSVPELGAANAAPVVSLFETLELRARQEHAGGDIPAEVDAPLTGRALSILINGVTLPLNGVDALETLPPFQGLAQRSSWPELQALLSASDICDEGSVQVSLLEPLPSNVEASSDRPMLDLQYAACATGGLVIDGRILIERPSNALRQPARVAYDALQLTATDASPDADVLAHHQVTGTLSWIDGDDCGVGERRIARLVSHDAVNNSVLLDGLESYTTAAPVLSNCEDASQANGWRGQLSFADRGVLTIDTPLSLSHDWRALPRATDENVLPGSFVPPLGEVRFRANPDDLDAVQASFTLQATEELYPGSPHEIAAVVHVYDSLQTQHSFAASLPFTKAGALSELDDSDSDGIPDAWERLRGLDPHDAADAALDVDGDGRSVLDDYLSVRY